MGNSKHGDTVRWGVIGLGWFGLYFFSQIIAKGAEASTGISELKYLSVPDLFQTAGEWFLSAGGTSIVPVLILLGLLLFSLVGLWLRMIHGRKGSTP